MSSCGRAASGGRRAGKKSAPALAATRSPLARQRGFTLMELSVTLAIFGIFLYIVVMLTSEMRRNEKKYPVNFMEHPQVSAVIARLRRDIFDTKYYPQELAGFEQTSKTLLLATINTDGTIEMVVYDFRTPGEVHRRTFLGKTQQREWVARGLPTFLYTPYEHGSSVGVELKAFDGPALAIDLIFIPRSEPFGEEYVPPTATST